MKKAGIVGLLVALAACSGGSDSAGNGTSDGGARPPSTGSDAGSIVVPASCDLGADSKDSPACVSDQVALFVDAEGGNDANNGMRASPVKSIGAALRKLGGRPRIYICGESVLDEAVQLEGEGAPSLYGGYSCADWTYVGTRANVAPTSPGFALRVTAAPRGLVVSDLAFAAKDGVAPGESSVTIFAASSLGITLRRVRVTAGKGIAGTNGSPVGDMPLAPIGSTSYMTSVANPLCPASSGGGNGHGGLPVITPVYPAGNTGNPTERTADDLNCSTSHPGSYGNPGGAGPGANGAGTLDETGWRPSDGLAGGKGGDAQGGGTGTGVYVDFGSVQGVWPGGNPGGCGGHGGAFGQGGGSSLAIIAFHSLLILEHAELVAADAGRGGAGAKGQKGQLPASYPPSSVNDPDHNTCLGANGGVGGSGGGGGGGAGGLSVGILHDGTAPSIDGVTTAQADSSPLVKVGAAGSGGASGAGGDAAQLGATPSRAGQAGGSGLPGQSKAVLGLP